MWNKFTSLDFNFNVIQTGEHPFSQTDNVQDEDQEMPEELDEKDIERQEAKMRSTAEENRKKDAVKVIMIIRLFKKILIVL